MVDDPARRYDSLEDAIYAVVHESAKPAKALAGDIGIRIGYLLDAANPHNHTVHFQARWIVPLTKASGNDALLRYFAETVGGLFVRLTPAASADEHTARSLKEFGDYLHSVADAHADATVTADEARAIRRQVNDVIEALLAHVATLEARVKPSSPPPSIHRGRE